MKKEMFHSRGYPKLMKDVYATHIGNAEYEYRAIAAEFVGMVGL